MVDAVAIIVHRSYINKETEVQKKVMCSPEQRQVSDQGSPVDPLYVPIVSSSESGIKPWARPLSHRATLGGLTCWQMDKVASIPESHFLASLPYHSGESQGWQAGTVNSQSGDSEQEGLRECIPLMHMPSPAAASCSGHHLSIVMGNRAQGYVIHSPVPACVEGGLTASPSISPHYSMPPGGEAD